MALATPARPAGRRPLGRLLSLYAPLLVFLVITLFPFYWMLLASLKTDNELYDLRVPQFVIHHPTLEHYTYLFTQTMFIRWALNTLAIALVSTTISLLCGVFAGYALARLRFRGATFLGVAIFITYLVPQTLLFLPLVKVVRDLGLSNSLWSMMLTYPTILIPFCTWLLLGYFRTIPRELEESALIDGASRFQAMVRIVLPLATPGILSAGIFAFTLSWNEFIYALVFTTSPEIKTIAVGVVTELIKGDAFFWGSLMAGALLGTVPVAIAYSFFVESYVAGLTAGGVKG